MSPATVSRVPRRVGLSRLKDLEPAEPVRRYERQYPGELININIKKLRRFDRVGHRITGDRTDQSNSRGVGWEFVHFCIDDASRNAFSQILPDEKKESAVVFLRAALAYYESLDVTVTCVMTNNGACYESKAFAKACRDLGLKHIRSRPYKPRTNDKPERFIQRRPCANGPMLAPIQRQTTGQSSCLPGCSATIGVDRTAVKNRKRRSVDST